MLLTIKSCLKRFSLCLFIFFLLFLILVLCFFTPQALKILVLYTFFFIFIKKVLYSFSGFGFMWVFTFLFPKYVPMFETDTPRLRCFWCKGVTTGTASCWPMPRLAVPFELMGEIQYPFWTHRRLLDTYIPLPMRLANKVEGVSSYVD